MIHNFETFFVFLYQVRSLEGQKPTPKYIKDQGLDIKSLTFVFKHQETKQALDTVAHQI